MESVVSKIKIIDVKVSIVAIYTFREYLAGIVRKLFCQRVPSIAIQSFLLPFAIKPPELPCLNPYLFISRNRPEERL